MPFMRAVRLSSLRFAARDRTAKLRPSPLLEIVLVISLLTAYDKLKDLGAARRSLSIAHGFALLHLEEHLHLAIEAPANRWLSAHALIGDLASYFYEFAWGFIAI